MSFLIYNKKGVWRIRNIEPVKYDKENKKSTLSVLDKTVSSTLCEDSCSLREKAFIFIGVRKTHYIYFGYKTEPTLRKEVRFPSFFIFIINLHFVKWSSKTNI